MKEPVDKFFDRFTESKLSSMVDERDAESADMEKESSHSCGTSTAWPPWNKQVVSIATMTTIALNSQSPPLEGYSRIPCQLPR
jgi:hypothetical protein